jgi:D-amino peptidase
MRLYISADMEGIAGVVSRENLAPGRFEYESARDWMTQAVLSACETAREMGASEVVVSDSHGNGQNLRFERLPEYVRLVRSWPRPLGMMQGVEVGAYVGAMLIGYHAASSNRAGTLAHTISGEFIHEVRLNGKPASEAHISAAIAGHFGVPILMFAGDDVAVAEAREEFGDLATATLKVSTGWLSALHLSIGAADVALREAVRAGIQRAGQLQSRRMQTPVVLEIRLRNRVMAEWLSYLSGIERVDAFTVRQTSPDMLCVSRFLGFLASARTAIG